MKKYNKNYYIKKRLKKIYEKYLINLLEPKYNTKMKNGNIFRFKLPKLNWYDYKDYMKLF